MNCNDCGKRISTWITCDECGLDSCAECHEDYHSDHFEDNYLEDMPKDESTF